MWNKQNIFEPSGCLSREALSALLKDVLPTDVKATAIEHAASCPFCSDALEGFQFTAPKTEMAEIMAPTDKLFEEKFFSNKKENNRKIIWMALLTAATILLLIGLFTIFNDKQLQKPQLADNAVPVKRIVPPAKIPKPDEPEPKSQAAQANTKDKTPVVKELNNSEAPQLSQPEIKSEMTTDEQLQAASVQENESQKKEVSGGVSVATTDNISSNETKLTMKSAAYNREKDYAPHAEYSPITASEAKHSNSFRSKKSGIIKEETSEQADYDAKQDTFITAIEELPSFQGGDINKFREYTQNQLKYSESLNNSSISGRVFVQFAVDITGKVVDIKILQGLHPDIDDEIIRVLKSSPLWKQIQKPVKHQFTMQLNIK